jgi:hypothetical protein
MTKLKMLKKLMAEVHPPHDHGNIPFSLFPPGLRLGALTSFSSPHGGGKTAATLTFLKENPELKAAWVEPQMSLYPIACQQLGIDLNRLLFVECDRFLTWTLEQLMKSGLFKVIVTTPPYLEVKELRRLQLTSERAGVLTLLLTNKPFQEGCWPISTQLEVSRSGQSLQLTPLKAKYDLKVISA